jgi:exopolyphosphatase/guanosine-5'-triphosphate,3'-diphosphate pyrophosphatase
MQTENPNGTDYHEVIAAVDLGSNSFHMIVARVQSGDLQIIDKMRDMVRLGEGLREDKSLDPLVAERALATLMRFGQRLQHHPPAYVRVVGTNTMRQLRSSDNFQSKAEEALGHSIEVIAGREEARLIYLGVAHGLAPGEEKRLVVDIGGGSTELIVGTGFTPLLRESLHMGCVSISRRFFGNGEITAKAMKQAELACALQIRPVREQFKNSGWISAVGSSGTIKAIRNVVTKMGWSEAGITRESLERLAEALVDAGSIDKLDLKGLSSERKPVFPGGVAILLAVFRRLKVDQMLVSSEALREGLIYDMIGRNTHEDARERTINTLGQRYNVDQEHANRVEDTAQSILSQVMEGWQLKDAKYSAMLSWAVRIHEIGLAVSHSQFHKHGAYLVENSDLSGFSRQEQRVLAALVRGHRRKYPNNLFETLPTGLILCTKQLCVVLRLAILMHRSRSTASRPSVTLTAEGNQLELSFPEGWLDEHHLTLAELKQEQGYLENAGFSLNFS